MKLISILFSLVACACFANGACTDSSPEHPTMSYAAWHAKLPVAAKRFKPANDAYWRLWWERGFQPCYAWKNTDPNQEHDYSRPLLKGEKPDDAMLYRSFYDAEWPQPKQFYDWMDKVSNLAARKDYNIDGDEVFFIQYWRKGYSPLAAILAFGGHL